MWIGLIALLLCSLGLMGIRIRQLMLAEQLDIAWIKLDRGHAVMAVFTRGAGEVFNAGTADWCYGLDADPQTQRVTANVLRRFGV